MIPPFLLALPWKTIGKYALIAGLLWFAAKTIYESGYKASDEDWQAKAQTVQVQTREIVREVVVNHTRYVTRLDTTLAHAVEQLQATPDDALSVLTAYARFDRELCNGSCTSPA